MATKKAASKTGTSTTTRAKKLSVTVARNANILKVGIGIEKAFKQAGCPGCRSGVDQIVFNDPVVNRVR